jgi:hypothetical protein
MIKTIANARAEYFIMFLATIRGLLALGCKAL